MARKRHTAEEIVAKLRQVEVLTAQGRPVAEAVRAIGVTEVTYYRWRSEYGGLKGDQVKLGFTRFCGHCYAAEAADWNAAAFCSGVR